MTTNRVANAVGAAAIVLIATIGMAVITVGPAEASHKINCQVDGAVQPLPTWGCGKATKVSDRRYSLTVQDTLHDGAYVDVWVLQCATGSWLKTAWREGTERPQTFTIQSGGAQLCGLQIRRWGNYQTMAWT